MRARLEDWLFRSGNRSHVAGGVLLLMTAVVLVPILPGFEIRDTGPLYYLASALITGNLTLITVVVAINQVILSQELESPGSLRDEIERTADYRQAALDGPAPPTDPSAFLRELLEQTGDRAESLADLGGSADDVDHRLLTDLTDHCERVGEQMEGVSGELSRVVVPILGTDYGEYINDCHRLRARYDEEDHGALHATLGDLTSDLENLDVARQYFTTTFMKEELARLSRSLLYIGVFAVSVPVALLLQLTTYPGSTPPTTEVLPLVVAAAVAGLVPLALLIAFVLRIATIAQEIAAISPFGD